MTKSIVVKNLTKKFWIGEAPKNSLKEHFMSPFSQNTHKKEFKALDDVSFEIEEGEFFGIIGRNGSGKSTLLKMLAGIYKPTEGKVEINGRVVPFLELGVGFNPELTARENIFLNGTILGMTRKKIAKKFDEIIEFAEVEKFIDTQLKNFSSGMQVRLAFAIAIQTEADIYIIDEILSVGDFAFQQKCFNLFKALKKSGKTFILVSHDLGAIRDFCDRVLYIKNGKTQEIGKTSKIVTDYIIQDRRDDIRLGKTKNVDFGRNTKEGGSIDVEVLDEEGEIVQTTISNPKLKIRVKYTLNEEALNDPNLIIGFGIFKDGDFFIFGTNSRIEGRTIVFKKEGQIDFLIEKFPMLNGHYDVSAAIHNIDNHHYVWKDQATRFDIIQSNKHDGLVDLNIELIDN